MLNKYIRQQLSNHKVKTLKLIVSAFFSVLILTAKSQTFYFTIVGDIFKGTFVNGGVSTYKEIGKCNFYASIALLKDTLYALDHYGTLIKSSIAKDTFLNYKTVFSGINKFQDATALTVSKKGKLYAMDVSKLYEIDPQSGTLRLLGSFPFVSAGDLIFYKDDLYLASTMGIAKLDTTNPSQSTLYIPYNNSNLIGLISMPISCNTNKIYGLLNQIYSSDFVEFDMENRKVVGVVSNVNHSAGDAASDVESGDFSKIRIDTIVIHPNCSNEVSGGSVVVKASVSSNESLTYSLNGSVNYTGLFNNLLSGSYNLKISTSSGCLIDSVLYVPFKDTVGIHTQVTNTICKKNDGIIKIVGASSGAKYTYILNNNPPQTQPIFNNLKTGDYTIQLIDSFGCISKARVFVNTILPNLKLGFDTKPSICQLNNGSISINDSNNVALTFALNRGVFQKSGNFVNLKSGVYQITAMTIDSCTFDTLIKIDNVTSVQKPIIVIDSIKNITCFDRNDASFKVNVSGNFSPYLYNINNTYYATNSYYNNLKPGNYNIKIKDNLGCIYDTFLLSPPYQATIPNKIISSIQPTCLKFNEGLINWNISGVSSPYQIIYNNTSLPQNNSLQKLTIGTYNFYIKDKYSCLIDSFSVLLNLKRDGLCDTIFVPTAFCPSGMNKLFRAIPYGNPEQFRLSVYDRTGNLVFTTTHFNDAWDGTYKGNKQGLGVYAWLLTYKFSGGEVKNLKGTVMLIR